MLIFCVCACASQTKSRTLNVSGENFRQQLASGKDVTLIQVDNLIEKLKKSFASLPAKPMSASWFAYPQNFAARATTARELFDRMVQTKNSLIRTVSPFPLGQGALLLCRYRSSKDR